MVWFVPSPQNPLKKNSELWNDAFRLNVMRKAVADMNGVMVCDVEFSLPKPNYTALTLRVLRKRYPDIDFALLIGGDNYDIFDKWFNYQEILDNHTVFVYPRDASQQSDGRFPAMQWLTGAPLLPISSTDIRNRLSAGDSIHGLVSEAVENDIIGYKQGGN